MKLEILTPERDSVSRRRGVDHTSRRNGFIPDTQQSRTIIASLTRGILSFRAEGKIKELEVEDGFVEAHDNLIVVCIETKVT